MLQLLFSFSINLVIRLLENTSIKDRSPIQSIDYYQPCLCPQVIMCSVGFKTSSDLSRKLVAVFQLSKELLSPQQHYDWGLRALKTVLSSAGLFDCLIEDLITDTVHRHKYWISIGQIDKLTESVKQ